METKLTREYAEKMALKHNISLNGDLPYIKGYMKAIEETNAKGLLEALCELEKVTTNHGRYNYNDRESARLKAIEAIKKASI
jgi:hypothetical protein